MPVCFVLHDFDGFSRRQQQTFLYSLFDLAQTDDANMAVVGLTPSVDALDLLEKTSSTPRVLHMLQFSLAPAFLLVGIGSIMNVMMARLTWVANRIERLEARFEEARSREYTGPCPSPDGARAVEIAGLRCCVLGSPNPELVVVI